MGREGRNERTDRMIWNPWKEIKRLRDQVGACMAVEDNLRRFLAHEQRHTAELKKSRDAYGKTIDRHEKELVNMSNTLLAIISEEKPTSNATVKRICKVARGALAK